MTGRRELFINLDCNAKGTLKFSDASKVKIQGVGSIIFEGKTGEHLVLHGVYYIPVLCISIMSLGQLDEGGSKVEIDKGVLRIWDQRGRLLIKVQCSSNRLYVLHLETAWPLCLTACKDDEVWHWHECFGHLHFDVLHKLGKEDMVHGLPMIKHIRQFYDTYVITK